ncbi:hypothetical protein SBRCBS47491_003269 [Sporothrix bragantina]|uniref:DUF676 domain-containing protein n=1 Tax=Sporothrix bragantina TaxID=671064 RepID=A0ABP0BDU4_9PEZI
MPRILLLCFVHGFKGGDNTFKTFPDDLKDAAAKLVPDHDRVETIVYPRYETKGELADASQTFLEWLKARVMDVRKAHLDTPWPPNDRQVGVVLVAHSMGGFVAADALCLALDERKAAQEEENEKGEKEETVKGSENERLLFPPIQGLLALDTPYNGLSRSMFVYGAFSNYSKVQTVFNVMTAVAAGPMALGRLALSRAGRPSSSGGSRSSSSSSTAAWKMWQLVAVRTGTVGAIAAGGVAAYTHRKSIMAGVDRVRRGWKKSDGEGEQEGEKSDGQDIAFAGSSDANASDSEAKKGLSLRESYQSGIDAIGQGLAYINRRNVGESFAWLSAHFTFVGALLKQAELNHRLQRLAGLQGGLGVHDLYVSLGANGYWSGGYFVPERTFCAIPERSDGKDKGEKEKKEGEKDKTEEGQKEDEERAEGAETAASLFERWTMQSCDDEVQAHISLFKRDKNTEYDAMTSRAAELVAGWFANEEPVVDTVGPLRVEAGDAATVPTAEENVIRVTDEGVEIVDQDNAQAQDVEKAAENDGLPDESPIDIAATASLMERAEGAEGTDAADKDTTRSGEKGSSAASAIVIDDDDDIEAAASTTPIPAEDRATYLRHLLSVAQNAGTGLKRVSDWSSHLPAKMPRMDGLAMPSMPTMPTMPNMPTIPTMPKMPDMPTMPKSASTLIPGAHMFSRSKGGENEAGEKTATEDSAVDSGTQTAATGPTAETVSTDVENDKDGTQTDVEMA